MHSSGSHQKRQEVGFPRPEDAALSGSLTGTYKGSFKRIKKGLGGLGFRARFFFQSVMEFRFQGVGLEWVSFKDSGY